MLIDELIADGAPGSGCDIACLMPQLRSAQKFVLAPEFASVADALTGDYTGLVKAFEFCRLPYAVTWVEFAHVSRGTFAAAKMQAPVFQVTPRRIGYLMTATRDDLSAWKTHLFWSTDQGCSCPALAFRFDMTGEIDNCGKVPTKADMDDSIKDSMVLHSVDNHPGWDQAAESVKLAMVNHTCPMIPDYGVPMPVGIEPHNYAKFYEVIGDLSRSDWAGEPAFLLAVIGLLNARNVVSTERVDYGKLNHARAKRGKAPLFEHKVLKIAHRQQERIYGDGPRGDYTPMRGHFVRGHFKTRRTGIYFWHPYARGSFGRGTIEKTYEMQS
jgi:hypothetical protein